MVFPLNADVERPPLLERVCDRARVKPVPDAPPEGTWNVRYPGGRGKPLLKICAAHGGVSFEHERAGRRSVVRSRGELKPYSDSRVDDSFENQNNVPPLDRVVPV